jgi:hypothetical protein
VKRLFGRSRRRWKYDEFDHNSDIIAGSRWNPRTDNATICISQSVSPEILLVHVISNESVVLKFADPHFDSNKCQAVVRVLGVAGPPVPCV